MNFALQRYAKKTIPPNKNKEKAEKLIGKEALYRFFVVLLHHI
jgi:hypothetical protein